MSSWNSSTDCCSWEGIVCDEFTGHVIELDLSANRLTGVIDSNSSLFQLSHLKKLNLAYNFLDGSKISLEFLRFTNLSHLNIENSGFEGYVSSEISQLNKLVSLDLSDNSNLRLQPHIFKVLLQNLTRLQEVFLRNVQIFSSLPNNFSSSLTIVDLLGTYLQGFPYQLFHLPNMQQISLGPFFDIVDLASVKWNTSSPLRKLELVNIVYLENLPNTIGNLKYLTYLEISYCEHFETLPRSFVNLTQLSYLCLFANNIRGQIPPEISGLEHLTLLDIGQNNLDAPFPSPAYNNLKSLKVVSLQENKLDSSSVSSFLTNLTQLETIILSYNPLYQIPLKLFNLSLLQNIYLEHTQLHGSIPKSFSKLVNLKSVGLALNNFSGPIVDALSNFVNLTTVDLSSNSLGSTLIFKSLNGPTNILG